MKPTVSLITTVHNAALFLEECLWSVHDQSFTNFEHIVWDDGSTDGSIPIILRVARENDRIKPHLSIHKGRCAALREACAAAKGAFIGLVDADDFLGPEALRESVAFLDANPEVAMVYTDHEIIDEKGQNKGKGRRCIYDFTRRDLLYTFMTHHFRLVRTEAFKAIGGFKSNYEYAMDYDFCLRLSEHHEIRHLRTTHYFYRQHPAQISQAHRAEQIVCAQRAVKEACVRRGMEVIGG